MSRTSSTACTSQLYHIHYLCKFITYYPGRTGTQLICKRRELKSIVHAITSTALTSRRQLTMAPPVPALFVLVTVPTALGSHTQHRLRTVAAPRTSRPSSVSQYSWSLSKEHANLYLGRLAGCLAAITIRFLPGYLGVAVRELAVC